MRLPAAGRLMAGWLEHRPLDGSDALLEARRASPREARRGCESAGQRRLGQERLRVVDEGGAEAARQQLTARLPRETSGGRVHLFPHSTKGGDCPQHTPCRQQLLEAMGAQF